MANLQIIIVDCNSGNLLSVRRAFEYLNATVIVTSDPDVIFSASKIILPGVGAFSDAMQNFHSRGLGEALVSAGKRGTALMGICLGMQILFDQSEEFELTKGLGLISGNVVPLPSQTRVNGLLKIPHIGWGALQYTETCKNWNGSVLQDIVPGSSVYFAHSFVANIQSAKNEYACSIYGGYSFPAFVLKENIMGCQFHPEKSGEIGLKILKNFLLL
ncbi:imidazole glycerol phosphate synthase subunit HisH [Candidatus Methylopumilus rimovensis]|uniref:Imidazole glycerol phosphate synthase subunit HisH n=1 Tax=Candidatus Methylopumilus rimovensis TaxID=2588535 RepID=A0AAE6FSS9_9PROT|nr:imidazole glycerol phosphate synthase subunit HisH [Candidatus Methylopumilus rimovensis]QDD13371.1 imidazole glycerol phosphate synthase subunit HisH [Candidatus Methylopumilus rimovensis]